MHEPLMKQGPKPKGCPLLMIRVAAVVALIAYLIFS
jgi:hypothetical protein